MSQSLYRKWRPKTWEDVIGQEHIVQTLRNAVAGERLVHAYLFAGPRGTGKTSTARILAKAVNCLDEKLANRPCNQCEHCQAINDGRFLDLIEIDAASNTSVDDVRDLRDKINFSPNQGKYKVYIIDEVHMLSTAAFNALLKTLEEPPSHAIFILATTEVHKIPATVLSRCQRHEFRRISVREIVGRLEQMTQAEGIDAEEAALTFLARQATGSMRDAISLLDQLASTGETITLREAQLVLGTAGGELVAKLVDELIARELTPGMALIQNVLDTGSDPRQFARQIVDYLRGLLLIQSGNAAQLEETTEVRTKMASQAHQIDTHTLLAWIRVFNTAGNQARNSWQPTLPLEMAFIEAVLPASRQEAAVTGKAAAEGKPADRKSVPAGGISPQAQQQAAEGKGKVPRLQADPLPMEIKKSWDKVKRKVREYDPFTQALLNSCEPMGIHKGKLVLAFNSDLLRTKMEQGEHLENTRKALQAVLGKAMQVRCTTTSERRQIPDDVDQDGLVATAVRDMGAKIVDGQ